MRLRSTNRLARNRRSRDTESSSSLRDGAPGVAEEPAPTPHGWPVAAFLALPILGGLWLTASVEAMSAFGLLGSRTAWAVFWLASAAGAFVVFPRIHRRLEDQYPSTVHKPPQWLVITVGGILALTFAVAIVAPPNNWDSMAYHNARVMEWWDHGDLTYWYTPDYRQLSMPPLASYFKLALLGLTGNDWLFNLVQWYFFLLAIAAAIQGDVLPLHRPHAYRRRRRRVEPWVAIGCGQAPGMGPGRSARLQPCRDRERRPVVEELGKVRVGPWPTNWRREAICISRRWSGRCGEDGSFPAPRDAALHLDSLRFVGLTSDDLVILVKGVHRWLGVDLNHKALTFSKNFESIHYSSLIHEDLAGCTWQFLLAVLAPFAALRVARSRLDRRVWIFFALGWAAWLFHCVAIRWMPYNSRLQLPILIWLMVPVAAVFGAKPRWTRVSLGGVALLLLSSTPVLSSTRLGP